MAKIANKECRICHEISDEDKMISPCECSGSIKYVHEECIQKWINIKRSKICETCKSTFNDSVHYNEGFDEKFDGFFLEEEYERIIRDNGIRLNNINVKNFHKYLCKNGFRHLCCFYFFIIFNLSCAIYCTFELFSMEKMSSDDIFQVKAEIISFLLICLICFVREYYEFNSWRIQLEQNEMLENFFNARLRN
jgi:hypothetical protein